MITIDFFDAKHSQRQLKNDAWRKLFEVLLSLNKQVQNGGCFYIDPFII